MRGLIAEVLGNKEYKPGEQVPESGIYKVEHDRKHRQAHQVTCIEGHKFPPCRDCGDHPRFSLVLGAVHVSHPTPM